MFQGQIGKISSLNHWEIGQFATFSAIFYLPLSKSGMLPHLLRKYKDRSYHHTKFHFEKLKFVVSGSI